MKRSEIKEGVAVEVKRPDFTVRGTVAMRIETEGGSLVLIHHDYFCGAKDVTIAHRLQDVKNVIVQVED